MLWVALQGKSHKVKLARELSNIISDGIQTLFCALRRQRKKDLAAALKEIFLYTSGFINPARQNNIHFIH